MIFSIQYLSYIYLQPVEKFLPIDVTFSKRTPAPIFFYFKNGCKKKIKGHFLFEKYEVFIVKSGSIIKTKPFRVFYRTFVILNHATSFASSREAIAIEKEDKTKSNFSFFSKNFFDFEYCTKTRMGVFVCVLCYQLLREKNTFLFKLRF